MLKEVILVDKQDVAEVIDLLCSAHEIASREGAETNWPAFIASVKNALIPFNRNGITARTYRLPNVSDNRAGEARSGSSPC